jgi:hypothetical protein
LEQWRTYYRSLLQFPDVPTGASVRDRDEARLGYVIALARKDSQYPADLARGILLQRLGMDEAAADALMLHLAERPEGPWRLRAQNHLAAARMAVETE